MLERNQTSSTTVSPNSTAGEPDSRRHIVDYHYFLSDFTVRIQFITQENVEHLRMIILQDTDVTWLKKNCNSCFCILNILTTTMTRLKIVISSIPT
jgi:hypothetical protein